MLVHRTKGWCRMQLVRNMLLVLVVGVLFGKYVGPVFGAIDVPEGEDPETWVNKPMSPEAKAAWDYRRANPKWTFGRFTTKVELMNMSDEEICARVLTDEKWTMSAEEIIAERERLLSTPGMRERIQRSKKEMAQDWYLFQKGIWIDVTILSFGVIVLAAGWFYWPFGRRKDHDRVMSRIMPASEEE
jgi:hypothetical protein